MILECVFKVINNICTLTARSSFQTRHLFCLRKFCGAEVLIRNIWHVLILCVHNFATNLLKENGNRDRLGAVLIEIKIYQEQQQKNDTALTSVL